MAKIDLWDSGDQFENEKVHYLTFGSEILLRNQNEAWRISTLIDNHNSNELVYRQLLSYFRQEDHANWTATEAFLIIEKVKSENQQGLEQAENKKIALSVGKEELNIKVPGTDGSWFKKNNFLIRGPQDSISALTKTKRETKEWSGIWVEDSSQSSHGIFQDIEVFIRGKQKSQVFCKGEGCGDGIGNKHKISYKETHKAAPDTWNKAYTTLAETDNSSGDWGLINENGATSAILDFIKDSKGKWSNSNDVCNPKNTEIDSEELKKLKVFCSKNKS